MATVSYQAFWAFNFRDFDGVDPRAEIERQLNGFADRGMTRVVLHLRFGHTVPYLSERWATLVGWILEGASRRGLRIIVWEDDAWPPGFVGGRLTRERPELRAHNMALRRRACRGPVAWELGALPVLAIQAVSEDGRAIDLLAHVGTHATQWSVFQVRHLYVGGDRQGDQVVYPRANQGEVRYFLDWTPPPGEWTVYWLERLDPAFKYNGHLLDSLSREATEARLACNYQWYHDRFAAHFGSVLAGFYCAEPPQNNWTPSLFAGFRERFGYPLERDFPRLGFRLDDRTEQVRMDYKRHLADLFARHYVAPVTRWCAARGVEFWARLEGDESIEVQSDLRGGLYPAVRQFSVPVFDLVNGTQYGDPAHPRLNTGINFCHSIARQNAAPTLFEGVGPVGWGMRLADADAQFNWAVVLGSASLQGENFFYSLDGYRKQDCPPSQSYQNPYWQVFGAWRDQYERLAAALADARPAPVEVALLLPIHSMNACRPAVPLAEAVAADERVARIEESFQHLHQRLLDAHVAVDIVDERALEEAGVEHDRLAVGAQRYRVVVLPFATHLAPEAAALLATFARAGGVLYADPGVAADTLRAIGARAVPGAELVQRLGADVPPGLPAGCYARFFHDGARRLTLLFNHTTRPVAAGAWSQTHTRLALHPALAEDADLAPGSLSLWREGAAAASIASGAGAAMELPASGWSVQMPENALMLDTWNIKVLGPGRLDDAPPAPASFGIAVCRPGPLYQQVELRGQEHRRYTPGYTQAPDGYHPVVGAHPFPLRVAYRCHIIPEPEVLDSLRLVMETEGVQGAWRLWINGRLVSPDAFAPVCVYDVGNRVLPLAPYLRPDAPNWIELQVQADQPEQGLLEPMRIMGAFALERHPNGPRLKRSPPAVGLGDWAGYGYGETSGWATCTATFIATGRERVLDLGMVHEVASVHVDDQLLAHLFKAPYRVNLPALAPGPHRVRIHVANGLGNLLMRLRHPAGLYGPVRLMT